MSLWRHRQSVVTLSADRKPSEWDTGSMCEFFSSFVVIYQSVTWQTVYVLTRMSFGVYFPHCCATREINTKITLSWAHKLFTIRAHILFDIYSIAISYFMNTYTCTIYIVAGFTWLSLAYRQRESYTIASSIILGTVTQFKYIPWIMRWTYDHRSVWYVN